jgi:dihydrofolate reductase
MRSLVRYYVAASLDGFIATADGGVEWLKPYSGADAGFDDFIRGIGAILLGRGTYEKMRTFGAWPYSDRPTALLTNRPVQDLPDGVETVSGSVTSAIARLRARVERGDIWLLGGGNLAAQCASEGVLDRIELYTMPVILNDGLPLFARGSRSPVSFELIESGTLNCGVVRAVYQPANGGR